MHVLPVTDGIDNFWVGGLCQVGTSLFYGTGKIPRAKFFDQNALVDMAAVCGGWLDRYGGQKGRMNKVSNHQIEEFLLVLSHFREISQVQQLLDFCWCGRRKLAARNYRSCIGRCYRSNLKGNKANNLKLASTGHAYLQLFLLRPASGRG